MLMLALATELGVDCKVAHVDHGIRPDSAADADFVREFCKTHSIEYFETTLELGEQASEGQARKARYEFLHATRHEQRCDVIATAHHFDDVIETVIINLLRGTGRRGFSSLKSTETIRRPLLEYSKADIRRMAHDRQLKWREDLSNQTDAYLRNRIRRHVIPAMKKQDMLGDFVAAIRKTNVLNEYIERELASFSDGDSEQLKLDRYFYTMIDHSVASELILHQLRTCFGVVLDRKRLDILYRFVRTGGINNTCIVHPDFTITARTGSVDIAQSTEKG